MPGKRLELQAYTWRSADASIDDGSARLDQAGDMWGLDSSEIHSRQPRTIILGAFDRVGQQVAARRAGPGLAAQRASQ